MPNGMAFSFRLLATLPPVATILINLPLFMPPSNRYDAPTRE
ncbi:MAG: hypothetical protein AAES65_19015 [Candidatus Thiodiazotropha sp. (ex. Lucinoma kazani)]